jgi:hypothetical protein
MRDRLPDQLGDVPTSGRFRVGDQVVCLDATDHAWFLHVGGVFEVDAVEANGRVSLVGMARAWEVERFRLVPEKRAV